MGMWRDPNKELLRQLFFIPVTEDSSINETKINTRSSNLMKVISGGVQLMNVPEMNCKNCGENSFVQATDYINLRPLDKKMTFGSEKIYTVCLDCGEVLSIKIKNPEKLK
jgi:hypothetical protein